jgi:Ca-activated chloride channel homolog
METIYHFNAKQISFVRSLFVLVAFYLISCTTYTIKAERIITGTVTSASDMASVPGVNVVIKGNTKGVVTDFEGSYSITVPDSQSILLFSFIGYVTKEVKVTDKKVIDVVLDAEMKSLDEVVIVNHGSKMKSVFKRALSCVADKCESSGTGALQAYSPTYLNPSIESYSKISENGFKDVASSPLSTFSIDVDRASYSNIRRFINQGQLPPADAVKIEEMINYFEYDYPQPINEHPFSITTEYSECPWQTSHKILHIGIQGKKIATENLPPSNIVFLLDVSGSMAEPNKLPLVKAAFKLLVNNLREKDKVAIVVYAGAAGLVLPSTKGSDKTMILDALNSLEAGGSTAGCEGITLAYKIAKQNFIDGGNNRLILATDGDFNVGMSNENELENFIVSKRKEGIFLTCLGFGMGNYKDSKIEILADKGNGNYDYIDDLMEANKVFVSEFGGTLFTIAKDVKIQIEFNPTIVQAYRLVGYENRLLNNEDFKDDTKDAGELGSGHTVTAMYEIIPVGVKSKLIKEVDPLKYQNKNSSENEVYHELATVKFRYKKPDGEKSIEMIHAIENKTKRFNDASENIRFSSSVAMFGMILRNSEFKGMSTLEVSVSIAEKARSYDTDGYRGEFIRLVKTAQQLGVTAEIKEF